MKAVIGVDFDNTIVCYDQIFHEVAVERNLIPPSTPKTKESVRNYLRESDREYVWIEMQGYVYGARMKDVDPFPGVIDFFSAAERKGLSVYIISHKTRHPYMGPAYDLHKAAYEWLDLHGFLDKSRIVLGHERFFFEETKEKKLRRIADMGCSHFIDDLTEFLMEEGFPKGTEKMLFSPASGSDISSLKGELNIFRSWNEISRYFNINQP